MQKNVIKNLKHTSVLLSCNRIPLLLLSTIKELSAKHGGWDFSRPGLVGSYGQVGQRPLDHPPKLFS